MATFFCCNLVLTTAESFLACFQLMMIPAPKYLRPRLCCHRYIARKMSVINIDLVARLNQYSHYDALAVNGV